MLAPLRFPWPRRPPLFNSRIATDHEQKLYDRTLIVILLYNIKQTSCK